MEQSIPPFSSVQFSSVQSLSHVWLFVTPWIAARQSSLSITSSRSLLKVMLSSHLILCRPLLLLSPIPPRIRVFSKESTLYMRWPKYWSFSFSVSPSNEHPGLISFRMDWLDLLAVSRVWICPLPLTIPSVGIIHFWQFYGWKIISNSLTLCLSVIWTFWYIVHLYIFYPFSLFIFLDSFYRLLTKQHLCS